MNQIPYNHSFQSPIQASPNLQHLHSTYWLACYKRHTGEVLWLIGMTSQDPASIQRLLPIDPSYECAMVEISNDWTFKWVGGPYNIIDTVLRRQLTHPSVPTMIALNDHEERHQSGRVPGWRL